MPPIALCPFMYAMWQCIQLVKKKHKEKQKKEDCKKHLFAGRRVANKCHILG
jgi:hypothetical protein